MPDDLDETIRENAQGPAKASGDSGSMEQHPLRDQIDADRYLASKKAARSKRIGVRITRIVPPGAN
ncbi:MAG: hypothetical protein WD066_01180 [Planctomycetaceae bacterium]